MDCYHYQHPPSSYYPPPTSPSYSPTTSNHPSQQEWRQNIYTIANESNEQIEALRRMLKPEPKEDQKS